MTSINSKVLLALVLLVACNSKKNSSPSVTETEGVHSQSVTSDKDGEWVRIDTGAVYFLSNQKFFAVGDAADVAVFQGDEGETAVYTNGRTTEKLKFSNKDLIQVQLSTSDSANPTIFHLLRKGVETATTKGQILLPSVGLRLVDDSSGLVLTNTNDPTKVIEVAVDENGNFETPEMESGEYQIEIKTGTNENSKAVVNDVRIETSGDDIGIITINDSPHNFKTLLIPRSDFSFDGEAYQATINVENIGEGLATGVAYTLSSDSENLIITNGKGILNSIPAGTSKTLAFNYQIKNLMEESKLLKVKITLKDTDGKVWNDYAIIEAWKQKLLLRFDTLQNTQISGLAIFKERKTYFFSVSGTQTVALPFIADGSYKFALSAKSLDQETVYSVGLLNPVNSGLADFIDTAAFEPNNSEDNATPLKLFTGVTSYVHIGDIDFFSFNLSSAIFPEGQGTASNPYLLKTADQMDYFSYNFTSLSDLYFKLDNDIDMTGHSTGILTTMSNVHFEGGNHTISNFKAVNPASNRFGFFANIEGKSTIQNLTIKNFDLTRTSSAGDWDCIGGLVGMITGNQAIVQNVAIKDSNFGGVKVVGGVVGCIAATTYLENITADNLTLEGLTVGTVVGSMKSGSDSTRSSLKNVRATNSAVFTSSAIYSEDPVSTGGLIGSVLNGDILQSSADVTVNGIIAGGLIGYAQLSSITNSSSSSQVSGEYAGGLVGSGRSNAVVNSFATGLLTGSKKAGGLFATSYVDAYPNDVEYAQYAKNTFSNSYWDATTTGQSRSAETIDTGFTTSQMQSAATFSGWDFTSIWNAPQTGRYPTLQ